MSRKKKIIIVAAAVVAIGLLVLALMPSPVDVSATRVKVGSFVEAVEDEGRTRLRDPYVMAAPISGYLRRVDLEPGDQVAAGQTVFVMEPMPAPALDPRTREQARETLAAARARLAAARSRHEMSRSEAKFAESEYQRQKSLFERQVISERALERARNESARAHAAERAARASVEAARFEMENARAVLEVAEGTRSPQEGQTLDVASPVTGVILRRERRWEGAIQAGQTVLVIGDLEDLEVQVDLLSMEAVRVRPNMPVMIERWGGEKALEGRVRQVEPAGFEKVSALGVDEQRVAVQVVIITPRKEWASLGEGYRVEARFVLWEGEDVIQIPTSALFRERDGWRVFVVENGRARQRAVEPGRRSGLWTQITDGLQEGELVITHPGEHVEDGSRVSAEVRAQ